MRLDEHVHGLTCALSLSSILRLDTRWRVRVADKFDDKQRPSSLPHRLCTGILVLYIPVNRMEPERDLTLVTFALGGHRQKATQLAVELMVFGLEPGRATGVSVTCRAA